MRNQAKYRAFLSYSHADARQAQSLHQFIEGYSIPKRLVGRETNQGIIPKRLRPVFKDPMNYRLLQISNQRSMKHSNHLNI
jgi:hypothetical protein